MTTEYNTTAARQDNLCLHDNWRLVLPDSCLFLLKYNLRWLMLADSSKSCFERRVTPVKDKGSPGDGALIITELGLEKS